MAALLQLALEKMDRTGYGMTTGEIGLEIASLLLTRQRIVAQVGWAAGSSLTVMVSTEGEHKVRGNR